MCRGGKDLRGLKRVSVIRGRVGSRTKLYVRGGPGGRKLNGGLLHKNHLHLRELKGQPGSHQRRQPAENGVCTEKNKNEKNLGSSRC